MWAVRCCDRPRSLSVFIAVIRSFWPRPYANSSMRKGAWTSRPVDNEVSVAGSFINRHPGARSALLNQYSLAQACLAYGYKDLKRTFAGMEFVLPQTPVSM